MSERYMIASARQGKTIDFKRWLEYGIPVYEHSKQLDIVSELDSISEIIEGLKTNLNTFNQLIKSRFMCQEVKKCF